MTNSTCIWTMRSQWLVSSKPTLQELEYCPHQALSIQVATNHHPFPKESTSDSMQAECRK